MVVLLVTNVAPMVYEMSKLFNIKINSDSPDAPAAVANANDVARKISDEGIVLLKNNENSLPLKESKVNVFSLAAQNIRYGGGGSGSADQSQAVNLFDDLKNAGIEYNETLNDIYKNHPDNPGQDNATGLVQVISSMTSKPAGEPAIDYLTDEVLSDAKDFSDNAIIVISSQGVEASDFTVDELRISQNQKELLDTVSKNFSNVIIVINAGNTMEFGFLEEYPSIKAALWIGTPGPFGCESLGNILAGKINPSGRLVDTYAYDVTSNPASVNFGNYKFTNINKMSFINYNEGIYIGYRFYETYYKNDETGYKNAVQFPFGHGLSYTDFNWQITNTKVNDEKVEIEVEVTNTGDVAGKDVVQIYFTPPYISGGIEKSVMELSSFAKTDLIKPGETETVKLEFATRDMSSYDMNDEEAYILEKGTYEIHVAKNVHDIMETIIYEVEENVIYSDDDKTGTKTENKFDYANGNLTYLSRNDWEGTYPDNTNLNYVASNDIVENFSSKPEKSEEKMPATEADNGIKLADLKDVPYNDEMWQDFLDQFTIDEMKDLFIYGAYRTVPVERLGVPETVLLDGPAGINSFFSAVTAASYPTEIVISSTWNTDLAHSMGEAVGIEANAYGVTGWYAPGMNIHRTPQGGRNYEYFSEDPHLSGKMSASIIDGAQSKKILVFMKHFVVNDQETNARSGLSTWIDEQTLREIYLRPFEISVKEGNVTGAMSSFILLGHSWCGGNEELLQDVLRDEWGFSGIVSTDAVLGKFMDVNLAVRYGNELMLDPMPTGNKKYINKLYKEDPSGIANGLRDRTHNICYTILNYTNLFD